MDVNTFYLFLTEVVQKACTSVFTDSQFEIIVKEWFRGAAQKYKREIKKNQKY